MCKLYFVGAKSHADLNPIYWIIQLILGVFFYYLKKHEEQFVKLLYKS